MRFIRGKRIATIRGVEVKLHISLIFLLIYIVLVASLQFPLVVESSGLANFGVRGAPVFWGVLFALGLFFSVFLHEFGHVYVAQEMGIPVGGITLMMLGGISEMKEIPEHKLTEFKLAVVGPLVSFAIALITHGVYLLSANVEFAFFNFWISRANLILGIFNILPIFPLDGGRAFRSLLATKLGRTRATEVAVRVSRFGAIALGILGILSFNILLLLIALFVYAAASGELFLSLGRDLLKDVRTSEIYTPLAAVSTNDSILSAAIRMVQNGHDCLPVQVTAKDHGAIVCAEEIKKIPVENWGKTMVLQVMRKTAPPLDAAEFLQQGLPQLSGAVALPVIENAKVVGLVKYQQIGQFLQLKGLYESVKKAQSKAAA